MTRFSPFIFLNVLHRRSPGDETGERREREIPDYHGSPWSRGLLRGGSSGMWILLTLISFALLSPPLPCHSQETPATPALADLQSRFDEDMARLNQPISQLNTSYLEALKRLMSSETASGKLDGALQVKTEIEDFGDGTDSTIDTFKARETDHPAIRSMRAKYLTERERLWSLGKRGREFLLVNYRAALTTLEEDLTKQENLDGAITVRKARDALDRDPRFHEGVAPAGTSASLEARVHFVAKGDVELRHNGTKLSHRNTSSERSKYIDGTSSDASFSVGDILVVRMKATAVNRGFVMSIEGIDGKAAIPVTVDDYRYLGGAISGKEANPDIETLIKIVTRPERGPADPDMATMWSEKPISDRSRAGSEWIKCGPGEDWHHYAVLLKAEMFQRMSD
jgi:hypothetical protein